MANHEKSQAERIAAREVKRAQSTLGSGWDHVSDEIRWGLVCANILGVIMGQYVYDDPSATTEQKAHVAEYARELWAAATQIHANGWK